MKRRFVLVFLVMAIAFSAGAQGNNEKAVQSAKDQVDLKSMEPISEYPIKSEKPITLTYWVPLPGPVSKYISNFSESPAYQQMEKDTGVHIEFIHPAIGQEAEQFNLMMASGKLPDIIADPALYKGGEFQAMDDGVILDLTDLIPVYAPDYYKYIKSNKQFALEVSDANGRIPCVYSYKIPGDTPYRRIMFRQDVLDQIGEKVPQNLDDYERIFQKMKDLGMAPYMLNKQGYEEQFACLFDTYVSDMGLWYKDLEGKVHYGPNEPGFKDYLSLLHKWYAAGYISKDFASASASEAQKMFDAKQVGMIVDAVVATYNRNMVQGYTATSTPYPRLYPGQKLHYERNDASFKMLQVQTFAAISKDCKNPEIALRVLNYGYTEKGAELLNWGVQGLNWDYVDGKRTYNDLMLKNPKMGTEEASYFYKMHFAPKLNYPDVEVHANLLKSPGSLEIRKRYGNDPNMDSAWILPPLQQTTEEMNRLTKITTDVDTYVGEMTLQFIIGTASLEKDYDSFKKTIESMGINEAIAIKQAAYDRYVSKKI